MRYPSTTERVLYKQTYLITYSLKLQRENYWTERIENDASGKHPNLTSVVTLT